MENGRTTDGGADWEREVVGERPSEAVVLAVADFLGRDPVAMPPLNRVIDPDALNNLFADTASGVSRQRGHLEFEYVDCRVLVVGDEFVRVEATD